MMLACQTGIWFDIGPAETPDGLKHSALTLKPSSPLYRKDEWMRGKDGDEVHMMTAYSQIGDEYDDLKKLMEKETGLTIVEYDTHYTLQVFVDVSECPELSLKQIQKKLTTFVERHFAPYVPEA